jgi:acid phosphatase
VLLLALSLAPAPATASHPPERRASAHGASKLLVFVVENHSLSQMRSQMSWTSHLGKRYGYATRYRGVSHPSLPNYLAIAAGSTFGVRDDGPPPSNPVKSRSVFGAALKAGLTARVYAEDMPSNCAPKTVGLYAVKHNPWPYFVHEHRRCGRDDTSLARFGADVRRGRLPNAGMVIPNLCNDAHNCPLSTADAWLKTEVGDAMSGPDFTSGRLVIVITGDESDGSEGNRVLTVVVHPSVRGVVTSTPLTHRSLCRLYTQVLGLPALRHARSAPSMKKAFGLRIRH